MLAFIARPNEHLVLASSDVEGTGRMTMAEKPACSPSVFPRCGVLVPRKCCLPQCSGEQAPRARARLQRATEVGADEDVALCEGRHKDCQVQRLECARAQPASVGCVLRDVHSGKNSPRQRVPLVERYK